MNYSEGPWYVDVQDETTLVEGKYQTVADNVSNCDADLIAAAPDLYEAMKAAIECGMVPKSSAKEGGAMRYVKSAHVADQIRAAIAKAEGRSND